MYNIKLQTDRLTIVPLSIDELELLIEDITEFETKLDLVYKGENLNGHLLDVIKYQYKKMQAELENYLWRTFWFFVLKNEKTIIGSAGFRSAPDIEVSVEIGYGINEAYQNKGYTTEAVASICTWALAQNGIKNITAKTDKNHIASQRVLEKCGFKLNSETTAAIYLYSFREINA